MLTETFTTPLRVFVADDDEDMLALVSEALQAHGCVTQEARDGAELLELLIRAQDEPALFPDVIVADVKMPRLSGLGVLAALKRASWAVPVIMITVVTDASVHDVARRNGAVGVLHKPFDPDDLVTAVHNATAFRDLHR
jgi:two-component system C4-dicarboxylate transport response regulator DctD